MTAHQRIETARRLDIKMVFAWIEKKSDLEAMAIMATDNSQVPLEKLEIGQLVLSMLHDNQAISISAVAKIHSRLLSLAEPV